jgi:uncharacterized repeat protein (TIGR01451 family)
MKFKILFSLLILLSCNLLKAQTTDLVIQLSAPASVGIGQPLTYTYTISNNGPTAVSNVVFSSNLPAGITNPVFGTCTPTGGATCFSSQTLTTSLFSATIPSLPVNGNLIVTITVTTPSPSIVSSLTNTATITTPPGITEIDPTTNVSTINTTIPLTPLPQTDIIVLKTADVNNGFGNPINCSSLPLDINYTVKYINAGPDSIDFNSGVILLDQLVMTNTSLKTTGYKYELNVSNVNWTVSSPGTSLLAYPNSFTYDNNDSVSFGVFGGLGSKANIGSSGTTRVVSFLAGDTITLTYTVHVNPPVNFECARDSMLAIQNYASYGLESNSLQFINDINNSNNVSLHYLWFKCVNPNQCPGSNIDLLAHVQSIVFTDSNGCIGFPLTATVQSKIVNNSNVPVTGIHFIDYYNLMATITNPGSNNSQTVFPFQLLSKTFAITGTSVLTPAITVPNYVYNPTTVTMLGLAYAGTNQSYNNNFLGTLNPFDTIIMTTVYKIDHPISTTNCSNSYTNFYFRAALSVNPIDPLYVDSFSNNDVSIFNSLDTIPGAINAVDLVITKSLSSLALTSGDSLTMTTIFSNSSPNYTVENAVWRDTLPETYMINLATITCSTLTGTVSCAPISYDPITRVLEQSIASFPPNSSLSITYNGLVNSPLTLTENTQVRCDGACILDCEPTTNFSQTNYQIIGAILPSQEFKAISANFNINNECEVKWYTVAEENTSNFIIERSIDGKTFDVIGSLKSKGNTNNRTEYLFEDNLASLDIEKSIYYRIKMIDIDNKYSYSNTIKLTKLNSNTNKLVIFPNPFKEKLAIKFMSSETSEIEIKLKDLNGKTIKQQRSQVGKGYNDFSINELEDLSSGQYFIIITDLNTNEEFSEKIVK